LHSYICNGLAYYFEWLRNIAIGDPVRCGIPDWIPMDQENTEWQQMNDRQTSDQRMSDLKKSRGAVS